MVSSPTQQHHDGLTNALTISRPLLTLCLPRRRLGYCRKPLKPSMQRVNCTVSARDVGCVCSERGCISGLLPKPLPGISDIGEQLVEPRPATLRHGRDGPQLYVHCVSHGHRRRSRSRTPTTVQSSPQPPRDRSRPQSGPRHCAEASSLRRRTLSSVNLFMRDDCGYHDKKSVRLKPRRNVLRRQSSVSR
jgi:hypothetical protein